MKKILLSTLAGVLMLSTVSMGAEFDSLRAVPFNKVRTTKIKLPKNISGFGAKGEEKTIEEYLSKTLVAGKAVEPAVIKMLKDAETNNIDAHVDVVSYFSPSILNNLTSQKKFESLQDLIRKPFDRNTFTKKIREAHADLSHTDNTLKNIPLESIGIQLDPRSSLVASTIALDKYLIAEQKDPKLVSGSATNKFRNAYTKVSDLVEKFNKEKESLVIKLNGFINELEPDKVKATANEADEKAMEAFVNHDLKTFFELQDALQVIIKDPEMNELLHLTNGQLFVAAINELSKSGVKPEDLAKEKAHVARLEAELLTEKSKPTSGASTIVDSEFSAEISQDDYNDLKAEHKSYLDAGVVLGKKVGELEAELLTEKSKHTSGASTIVDSEFNTEVTQDDYDDLKAGKQKSDTDAGDLATIVSKFEAFIKSKGFNPADAR